MAHRDLVVIGASAGGLEALCEIVRHLPAGLPAAILIVVHVPPTATSALPSILARCGRLPAVHATGGSLIEPGKIHVAPPGHHLSVRGTRLMLSREPRVNGHRPAIDPLFFSAARWMGSRTIGVVLSGVLDDGAAGLRLLRNAGGLTVAQEPSEAQYAAMPQNAIDGGGVMHILPATAIAEFLAKNVGTEVDFTAPTTQMPVQLAAPISAKGRS